VKDRPLPKPREIKAHLDQYVIGQERAKIEVSVAAYDHYKRRKAIQEGLLEEGMEIEKSNILLLGPSGSGKTYLFRALARKLDVPFFVSDASQLTQAGYVGADVESMLQGLMVEADNDVERAEWGIILLDEVDKIARKSGRGASGYRDVSGEGVQQALLKLIEGSKVQVPRGGPGSPTDTVDTTNILFVCAGSFAGIEELVVRKANQENRVGFGAPSKKKLELFEIYNSVTEEDVLDFGIIPEMVGRLPLLTTTLPLTEDEMVRILTEPKDAITKQLQASFSLDGVELVFEEEALRQIGQMAQKRPTGARALRSIVKEVTRQDAFECPDSNVRKITVTVKNGELTTVREEEPQKVKVKAVG
jgi:ATP-dependent Clp protease ATP-binding subunit ClpX